MENMATPALKVASPRSISSVLQDYFISFAEVTGLGGFQFVLASKSRLERIFWLIMVAAAVGMTIYDVSNTIQRYSHDVTTTSAAIRRDGFISFPSPTLCVEYETREMLKAHLDGLSLSDINAVERTIANCSSEMVKIGVQDDTGRLNSRCGRLAVAFLADMLADITRIENSADNKTQKLRIWSTHANRITHSYVTKYQLNLGNLIKNVGAYLCELMNITVFVMDSADVHTETPSIPQNPCSAENVKWVGPVPFEMPNSVQIMCLTLQSNTWFNFSQSTDITTIKVASQNLYEGAIMPSGLTYKMFVLFTQLRVKSSLSLNPLQVVLGRNQTIAVNVEGFSKALNTRRNPCSGEEPQFDCLARCQANYIMRICRCFPLTWFSAAENREKLPFCGEVTNPKSRYTAKGWPLEIPHLSDKRCDPIFVSFNPDEDCDRRCEVKCEYRILGYDRLEQLNNPDNTTYVQLQVNRFVYPYFEEFLVMNQLTFLSNLGGNFSLWLGASFIAVIHVIVFVVRMLLELCLGVRKTTESYQMTDKSPAESEGRRKLQEFLDSSPGKAFLQELHRISCSNQP